MIETFNPHLEILTFAQKWIYSQLSVVKFLEFTLYGGTALGLQYGHRKSVDFDFFSQKNVSYKLLKKALPILGDPQLSKLTMNKENALTFQIKNPNPGNGSVKLSFFGGIDFGRVGEPKLTNDGILLVASPKDIFALKLKVIMQRPSTKDYLDIIQLIRRGESLERGLAGASLFFGNAFSPQISLRTLTYFSDLDPPLKFSESAYLTRISYRAMENIATHDLPGIKLASKKLTVESMTDLIISEEEKEVFKEVRKIQKDNLKYSLERGRER